MVKFACDCCGRSYSVAEELRGRAFKMKCKLCGHLIVVKPTALGSEGDSASHAEPIGGPVPYSVPEAGSSSEPKHGGKGPDLPFSGRGAGLGLGDWLPAPSAEIPPPNQLSEGPAEPPPGGYLDFVLDDRPGTSRGATEATSEVTDSSILGTGETPQKSERGEEPSGLGDPFAGWTAEEPLSAEPELREPVVAHKPARVPEKATPSLGAPVAVAEPPKKGGKTKLVIAGSVTAMVLVAGLLYLLASRDTESKPGSSNPTIVLAPGASSRPQLTAPQLAAPDPQFLAGSDKGKPEEGGRVSAPSNRPNSTKVAQVIAAQRQYFDECTTQAANRNPAFEQIKKAILIVTVVPTGDITSARLDDPSIDDPQLSACLKRAAKRMAFPSFDGGPLLIDVPLTFSK